MNPLPTPFDIKDIPYFAYEPNALLWNLLIAVFLLLAVTILLHLVFGAPKIPPRDIQSSIRKLKQYSSRGEQSYVLKRIHDLGRGLLAAQLACSTSSLSHRELEELRSRSRLSPALTALLDELIWISQYRFSGHALPQERITHAIDRLLEASESANVSDGEKTSV